MCKIATLKQMLPFLMLLGALLGLLGQEAAFASSPPSVSGMVAGKAITEMANDGVRMSADCMAMMQKPPLPEQKPCKGLTLDCIAAMGCVIPLAIAPAPPLIDKVCHERMEHFPAPANALSGCAFAPEPEPPTVLI